MSKNDDALQCADDINSVVPNCSPLAAAHLRRLVAENEALRNANEAFGKRQDWWNDRMVKLEAENEAQAALLRQAVEALEKSSPQPLYSCRCQGNEHWMYCHLKRHQDTLAAIRQHLEGKA